MTRAEFEKKAIRKAEKEIEVPAGWWGTWREVHGPEGECVRFSGWQRWSARVDGFLVGFLWLALRRHQEGRELAEEVKGDLN